MEFGNPISDGQLFTLVRQAYSVMIAQFPETMCATFVGLTRQTIILTSSLKKLSGNIAPEAISLHMRGSVTYGLTSTFEA